MAGKKTEAVRIEPGTLILRFDCPKCKEHVEGSLRAIHVSSITDGCESCGYGAGATLQLWCPKCGDLVDEYEKDS